MVVIRLERQLEDGWQQAKIGYVTLYLTLLARLRQKQEDKEANHQDHTKRDAKYGPLPAFYR